jgi:hypothetical protein
MNQESGLKGLMPLRNPQREKVVTLPLHSSFHENKHFQILRLQVKETCKHLSITQAAFLNIFAPAYRTLFQQKLLLFTPAARVAYLEA